MFALFSFRNDEHTYLAVVVVVDGDGDVDGTIVDNDDLNSLNKYKLVNIWKVYLRNIWPETMFTSSE